MTHRRGGRFVGRRPGTTPDEQGGDERRNDRQRGAKAPASLRFPAAGTANLPVHGRIVGTAGSETVHF
jgi:hypothetical protein